MPDAGEIKAKVTIEYDGSGAEAAKKDLASLADISGGLEESAGGASDGLAALDEQMGKSAGSAKSFTAAIEELPKIAESGTSAVSDMTDAMSEQQGVIADTAQSLEAMKEPLKTYTESLQAVSDTVSKGNLTENMSAFQDALENPYPFQMIGQYLNETGQNWGDFTSSIGDNNTQMLHEMATNADVTHQVLGGMSESFQSAGKSIADSINWDEVGPPTDFTAEWSKVGDTLVQTGTAAEGAKASMGGGFFSSLFSTEEAGSIFGGGGIMGMLSDVAMPLMAVQMIGMAVGAMGQGIYNAAAIAEGPAAHGFGTFTGAIDIMTASANKAGQTFSESFGQGVLPALNAVNDASQGGSNGFLGQLGQGLGMEAGIAGAFTQIVVGGIVGGAAKILTMNPANTFGQDWVDAGTHGLANYWANWTGQSQPYPGPTPPSQSQIYYQQQMSALPNTIAMSASQMQAQATTTLAEATDPNWLAAQNQLSASQRAAQYLVQNYDSRHPQSQYDLIQQAQYESYAAQQQMNYQAQMSGGGGVFSGQAPSTPLDFLTGMGPASVGGFQGQGGETWGQSIGKGIQDFFSSNGAGGQAMQFLTGFGGNTGGGQTYGQSIGGFFGGIGADIGGFFGGIGNFLGGGGAPASQIPSGGGCFPAGTHVLLANGDEKPIETLQVGEQVQSHDGTAQRSTTVLALIKPPPRRVYELVFSDGNTLTLTDSHPIATSEGWKSIEPKATEKENPGLEVSRLMWGDVIYTTNGTCQLASITPLQGKVQVYNITVDRPHTFYANKILVHNKMGAMSNSGEGSENVSLSHTFTATVNWAATGLEKQFTAAAQWAEQNLTHTAVAAAQWAEQNLVHTAVAAAQWAEQNLTHSATAAAQWAEENLIHPAIAAAQWAEQGLVHEAIATATWAEQGLEHLFTGKASWIGEDLNHMFTAVAQWTAQNLNPSFTVNPSVTMLAEGTSNFAGGPAIVAEAGYPEVVEHNGQYSLFQGATLLDLPAGANVYPMKNLASSSVAQFADGTDGPTIPLTFGARSGDSAPSSMNIYLNIDGQTFWSSTGLSLAQNVRASSGFRGF